MKRLPAPQQRKGRVIGGGDKAAARKERRGNERVAALFRRQSRLSAVDGCSVAV